MVVKSMVSADSVAILNDLGLSGLHRGLIGKGLGEVGLGVTGSSSMTMGLDGVAPLTFNWDGFTPPTNPATPSNAVWLRKKFAGRGAEGSGSVIWTSARGVGSLDTGLAFLFRGR